MFLKNEFDQSDETGPFLYRARKELSDLHVRLAEEGFTEVFVDQLTKDMVAVTRHCPLDRRLGILPNQIWTHFTTNHTGQRLKNMISCSLE